MWTKFALNGVVAFMLVGLYLAWKSVQLEVCGIFEDLHRKENKKKTTKLRNVYFIVLPYYMDHILKRPKPFPQIPINKQ